MQEGARIPDQYTSLLAGSLEAGRKVAFGSGAMAIDLDDRGWIDPLAEPLPRPGDGGGTPVPDEQPYLVLEWVQDSRDSYGHKAGRGLKVDLGHAGDHVWVPVLKRPETDGFPWLPVVEFAGTGTPPAT